MEDLNKQQLILLALLVSFVTSIATGIATVSLMDQAPAGVTQTIHRVVEKTVERVVPSQAATVVTTEKTVIVSEQEVLVESVAAVEESIVRISVKQADGTAQFAAIGVVLTPDGVVATAEKAVSSGTSYDVTMKDGTVFISTVVHQNPSTGVALLAPSADAYSTSTPKLTFKAAPLGDPMKLALGESVAALGGKARTAVAAGIVSGLKDEEPVPAEGNTSTTTPEAPAPVPSLAFIETNLAASLLGTPLIDLYGAVVGMATSTGETFAPVSRMTDELGAYRKSEKEKEPA